MHTVRESTIWLWLNSTGVGAVSLVLCDDAHITSLNATHRGKSAPTDVLSFELDDDMDYKVRVVSCVCLLLLMMMMMMMLLMMMMCIVCVCECVCV